VGSDEAMIYDVKCDGQLVKTLICFGVRLRFLIEVRTVHGI
jgi:hypothetical protein